MTCRTSPSPAPPILPASRGGPARSRPRRVPQTVLALAACLLLAVLGACSSPSSTPAGTAASRSPLDSMVPASVKAAGLVVLTDPAFKPISFYAPGSATDIAGSDPDIIRAMAAVLGVRVRFVPIGFEGMLTGVGADRGNVAAGGLTDTSAREKVVDFIDDFSLGELFVVKRGAADGVSAAPMSVCGHTVAYTIGAVSQAAVPALGKQCAAAGNAAIKKFGVAGVPATISAVLAGRAQVAMYDNLGFDDLNKASGGQLQAFTITPYPRQFWGFAVSKAPQGEQLAKALLAALKAIQADGTYQKILLRYGVGGDALLHPGINLQGAGQN